MSINADIFAIREAGGDIRGIHYTTFQTRKSMRRSIIYFQVISFIEYCSADLYHETTSHFFDNDQ